MIVLIREEEEFYLGPADPVETREIVENYFCLSTCNGFLGLRQTEVSQKSIRHINPSYFFDDDIPKRYYFPDPLPDKIEGIFLGNGQQCHLGSCDLTFTLAEAEQRRNKDLPPYLKEWTEIFSIRDFTDKVLYNKENYLEVEERLERYKYQISREILAGKNIKYGMFIRRDKAFECGVIPPHTITIIPYEKEFDESAHIEVPFDKISKIELKYIPDPDYNDEKPPMRKALFISFLSGDGTLNTCKIYLGDLAWLKMLRVPPEKIIDNTNE